jgi:UTP--glucose-1-phosphate uridylyltransferase
MQQMVEMFGEYHSSVIGVQNVDRKDTAQYGIVASEPIGDRLHRIAGIVEKPKPDDAPSTLGVVGRYLLKPRIFHYLEQIQAGAGGEIQLTDGIASLLQEERILAYEFMGTRYDCGTKLGYLQATLAYGLKHAQVGKEFRDHVKSLQLS